MTKQEPDQSQQIVGEDLSSPETGLSDEEAKQRLERFGFNEIVQRKKSRLLKFAGYFWGPIPWMIEVAAILSAFVQHWEDLAIISSLLAVNAVIGFWQENKADTAIELLKKRLALTARVLRNGVWRVIPSRELVPGDRIRVRLGDIVPADIKLTDGDYLLVDESALTGESLPVEKHVSDQAYSGSIAKQGEMDAIVTLTGEKTYFGKTAKLVEEAKTRSHFQKAVIEIGDYLIIIAVALVSIVFAISIIRGESLLETLQFALILLVASIPVALPAVLSVTMAVGAIALSKKEAIVTKLESIEEIAGMDILCADKTGTITKNELSVAEVKPFGGFSKDDILLLAVLASRKEDMDPIDGAIFHKVDGSQVAKTASEFRVLKYTPFDPVSKRTEAVVSDSKSNKITITKGAPQVILSLCNPDPTALQEANRVVESFAAKGFRALGAARSDSKGKMSFAGLIGLYDPPRDDSKETIASARELGISVKMITGDHLAIAGEISGEVGIGKKVIRASDLGEVSTKASEIEGVDAFAEVLPEHKYRIVETLQGHGHIVGMTGDGVNDAPALKKADAGIAVSGATDAARSAADIVLTKSGLSVIIDAMRQSRKIFERMNSYAIYRIAETLRVLLFLSLSIIIFSLYPLTAPMLVILALLNDIPIMMIAYDNARVQKRPVSWNMRKVLTVSSILGLMGVLESFMIFIVALNVFHLGYETLQTFMFLKLAVAGHMTIYLARTPEHHFWNRPLPASRLFLAAEITQIAATLFAASGLLMAPLSWGLVAFIWGYALAFFVIEDYAKIGIVRFLAERFHWRFA